jgi:hypothetical protein
MCTIASLTVLTVLLLAGHGLINLVQHPEILMEKMSALKFATDPDPKIVELENLVKRMYTGGDLLCYSIIISCLIMLAVILVWLIGQCMAPPAPPRVPRGDFHYHNITPFLRHRLNRNIAALQYIDSDEFEKFYKSNCNPDDSFNAIHWITNLSEIPARSIRSSPDTNFKDANHYKFGKPMVYYELMLKWCDIFTQMQAAKFAKESTTSVQIDKPKNENIS